VANILALSSSNRARELPAILNSNATTRAVLDRTGKKCFALRKRQARPHTRVVVHGERELVLSQPGVDAPGPLLGDLVDGALGSRGVVAECVNGLNRIRLVVAPRLEGCVRVAGDARLGDVYTQIRVGQHGAALGSHGWVPLLQVFDADVVQRRNLVTVVAGLDIVEAVTVLDHARLRGRGRRDARRRRCGRCGRGSSAGGQRRRSRYGNAGVVAGQQVCTVGASIRVPLQEICQREAVLEVCHDFGTEVALLDQVILGAARNDAWLSWRRLLRAGKANEGNGKGSESRGLHCESYCEKQL
jgi:hypothetical protein